MIKCVDNYHVYTFECECGYVWEERNLTNEVNGSKILKCFYCGNKKPYHEVLIVMEEKK